MSAPQIVYWNPEKRRFRGRIGRRLPFMAPVNNFGDLLGPLVVSAILARHGITTPAPHSFEAAGQGQKLFSVGSVLHFADTGDIVWGSGRNGKVDVGLHSFEALDVRMVRGPLTRAFLMERGIDVPEIYGDPGLLLPALFPERMAGWQKGRGGTVIVPNLNDPAPKTQAGRIIDPRRDLWRIVQAIYEAERVVSSSLHGFILAEAFGVPARLLRPKAEAPFNYDDYANGTGRESVPLFEDIETALAAPNHPPAVFDAQKMIDAFPLDAFR